MRNEKLVRNYEEKKVLSRTVLQLTESCPVQPNGGVGDKYIFNLGNRWRRVASFTLHPLYHRKNSREYKK